MRELQRRVDQLMIANMKEEALRIAAVDQATVYRASAEQAARDASTERQRLFDKCEAAMRDTGAARAELGVSQSKLAEAQHRIQALEVELETCQLELAAKTRTVNQFAGLEPDDDEHEKANEELLEKLAAATASEKRLRDMVDKLQVTHGCARVLLV